MTLDIPFFLPSSFGLLASIASLPGAGALRSRAIVLLGEERGAARQRWQRPIAHSLAERGHPVLRFSYPGAGMSPVTEMVFGDDLIQVTTQACKWFQNETGAESLGLLGSCRRARSAILTAEREPAITRIAAICPLIRGKDQEKFDHVLRAVQEVTTRCELHMIYGAQDRMYEQLVELNDDGKFGTAWDRMHFHLLEGATLHGLQKVEDYPWLEATVEIALSEPESSDQRVGAMEGSRTDS